MTRKEEREQAARNFESIEYNSPYTNFIQGAEWADKTMIDKVCNFIKNNGYKYGKVKFVDDRATFDFRTDKFIEELRKAMEE